MRIHVLSDLHLEFGPFDPPIGVAADVTVLAGDLWTRARLGSWPDAPAAFGRPVVVVAGNHDYWHSSIGGGVAEMRAAAAMQGVTFLERDATVLDGVRFLGCTLWTDFRLRAGANPEVRRRDMGRCHWQVGDYGSIRIDPNPGYETFDPQFTARIHARSRAWLETALSEVHAGPTVVVTHHAPSARCLAPGWTDDPVSAAYASDLEGLMVRHRPALWIHGHTHLSADFVVGNTRVLSNPRGYSGRRGNRAFDPRLVVDVAAAS